MRIQSVVTALILGTVVNTASATVFVESVPDKISNSQAAKLMRAEKPVWRCRKNVLGENINPVAAKGSKNSWHAVSPGDGIDIGDAVDKLADGGSLFKCDPVRLTDTGRVGIAR